MVVQAIKNVKWTVGNIISLISIVIVVLGTLVSGIKWSRDMVKDIKAVKTIAKDNRGDIKSLQKCERDANTSLAQIEVKLDGHQKSIDKLEYKVDRIR